MRSPFAALLITCAALLSAAGCGPKGIVKITVQGTVTYKGQKVSSGILQFIGDNGAYSAATIQDDGTYVITDVVPGETKVGVMEAPQGSGSSSGGPTGKKAAPSVNLPQKYRDPNSSGLKYTITESTKELNIAID